MKPIISRARYPLVRQSEVGCLELWHTFGCDVPAVVESIDGQVAEARAMLWHNTDMRDDYIAMLRRLREYADAEWIRIDDLVWGRLAKQK